MSIVKMIYRLSKLLPKEERYGLTSQMCRAAVSLPSNIAEGCSRNSDADFCRFLEMALGSLFELETQLLVVQDLHYAPIDKIEPILNEVIEEEKMISRFIIKLRGKKS